VNAPLREISDLPGPRGMPFFGNALQISPGRMHGVLEQWQREYGDCFRFNIAYRRLVVIADPEAIASVFRDRPDGFQRTERLNRGAREMGFGGLFSANGAQWRRQRPMVMAGFDPAHIKAYFPMLLKVTERFARRWQRAAAAVSVGKTGSAGEAIDLQADLMRYTVDVTAGLAFGADINTIESEEETIQRHLDKVLPALFKRLMAPFPWLNRLPLPANLALARHLEALHTAVDGFIADARRRIEADPALRAHPANLIEAMVVARDTAGSGLTDQDVAGNVLTMLLAGEDTTANTLAWMIYLLSRNPAALRRARDEVRGLLGGPSSQLRLPTREQLQSLDYIEACTNETMRLKPVAPVMVNEAVRDSVVAGIRVPKGQLVVCLMRPSATDERNFKNAAAFDPSRWLEANAAGTPSSSKRVSMPFGAGPRLCPGRYLAVQEMKMVMAMLLANFDIESVTTPDGGEAREYLHLTMAPVGLRLRLGRDIVS
jgi:cytochrome P450